MGRAKKLKQLRKAARTLPEMTTVRVHGVKVAGHEIIKSDVKEIKDIPVDKDGSPIDPDHMYRRKELVRQPVNHYRKMKKLMNRYGLPGVVSYGNAIIDIDTRNKVAQIEELNSQEEKNESNEQQ